jgi:hypothetical protein
VDVAVDEHRVATPDYLPSNLNETLSFTR